jgi:hypothetical protein
MILRFAIALALSCLVISAWAQSQPAPMTAPPQAGAQATKPAVTKRAPKTKTTAKPSEPAESGSCQFAVIPALGDQFVVQKVGLTVFGNERTEVPIDWGLNDIVVARVRAAAPGTAVRRLAYAKGAFQPYYNPTTKLFHNSRDDLTAIVRQIAANAGCERYVVVVTFTGTLPGTNQTLDGIGALKHGTSLYSRGFLFTNLSVIIFDGQTFEIQRNPSVNLGSALARAFQPAKQDPLAELDDASFPDPAAAANNAALRDRVRALLSKNLDKILPAFFRQ